MDDSALAISFGFGLIFFLLYNLNAQMIIKEINSLTRAVCDVATIIIIWIVGIVLSLVFDDDSESS